MSPAKMFEELPPPLPPDAPHEAYEILAMAKQSDDDLAYLDECAMRAMQGLITHHAWPQNGSLVARGAYGIAAEMLAEKKKVERGRREGK